MFEKTGKRQQSDTGTPQKPARPRAPSPLLRLRTWAGATPQRKFAITLGLGIAAAVVMGYLAALLVFPAPSQASERDVPRVIGLGATDAARELRKQGLTDTVEARETHPTAPPGSVIWQDPPSGTAVPRGSAVTLTLSAGPPLVTIPDVHGFDSDMAQKLLLAAGLHVDAIDSIDMKSVPTGLAAGTTPEGGQRLTSGRTVTLHLAR